MPILNLDTLEPKITINEDDFNRFYNHIKRSLQLGESLNQIANDTGISASTISTKLARMGTSVKEVRASRPEWRKKNRTKKVVDAGVSQLTTKQLADKYCVKDATVTKNKYIHGHFKGYVPVGKENRSVVWSKKGD